MNQSNNWTKNLSSGQNCVHNCKTTRIAPLFRLQYIKCWQISWWYTVIERHIFFAQLLQILPQEDRLCANVQHLLPLLGADIQWEVPPCSHSSPVNQRGSSRTGWEAQREDRSCFDRGGVLQRYSLAVHWQRESQATVWHSGLLLTLLCLVLPLMWA